jgi:hypothetical protein
MAIWCLSTLSALLAVSGVGPQAIGNQGLFSAS